MVKSSQLSSDILEQQFGPTMVDILYQDDRQRIIQTRVIHTGEILELSWVKFDANGSDMFPAVHQTVIEGESIGKAFRAAGVEFMRHTNAIAQTRLPQTLAERLQEPDTAWVVDVTIMAGEAQAVYATILEVYNPDVQWPEAATEITTSFTSQLDEFANKLSDMDKL